MLTTDICGAASFSPEQVQELFALFARYYANTDAVRFADDLRQKQDVIRLRSGDRLVGFTTIHHDAFDHEGRRVAVLFSGDTIVDRPYWGNRQLAFAWLRAAGRIARGYPDLTPYWFLIVKGHRTYRYMPSFGYRFVPGWQDGGDDNGLLSLRNALAAARFGPAFDPATGVVRYHQARDHLAQAWVEPTRREQARDDVAFFLRANPGFRAGDELACLCPLTPDNMRPLTRRLFESALVE